jgi:hypothetical protein
LIKNAKNKKLNFEEYTEEDERGGMSQSNTLNMKDGPKKINNIYFSPSYRVLNPNEKSNILITIDCYKPETILEHLEIMVENCKWYFIDL